MNSTCKQFQIDLSLKMPNKKDLRVSLGEDLILKIKDLKKYYGIKNTSEIIRLLITEKHREIQFRRSGE